MSCIIISLFTNLYGDAAMILRIIAAAVLATPLLMPSTVHAWWGGPGQGYNGYYGAGPPHQAWGLIQMSMAGSASGLRFAVAARGTATIASTAIMVIRPTRRSDHFRFLRESLTRRRRCFRPQKKLEISRTGWLAKGSRAVLRPYSNDNWRFEIPVGALAISNSSRHTSETSTHLETAQDDESDAS